jgi:hypothetical protein
MNAPPKRVAPAKSASARRPKADVPDVKNIEDTIAGTAPKRPPQTTSTPAPAIAPARRRIKVTRLEVLASEDKTPADTTADKPAPKKSKSMSRGKKEPKIDDAIKDDPQQVETAGKATKPKTRAKVAADKVEVDETRTAPKTRSRPKNTTASEPIEEPPQQQPVRQTRTRAGSGAAATQATAASTAKATAGGRKRVTFQDLPESDKENQPLVAKKFRSKDQGVPAPIGIRAKPVRKPPAAKGRKTAGTTSKNASAEPRPTPLSPKKVTQVAKSSSPGSSDEDELSGAKTPVRDLSLSPKRSAGLVGTRSPVKKLDFGTALPAKSPDSEAVGVTLMSPPRKLPPSPFKDALKESPRRGDGALIFPSSALKATTATVLSAPPFHSQSVLLQSPKRGAIDSSIFTQSAVKRLKSPEKPTLMQSPPKRLFPSFRSFGPQTTSAEGANRPVPTDETHQDGRDDDVAISCDFRASQSPERSIRVHKVGGDELALGEPGNLDFDESVLDIRSPIKISKQALPSLQSMNEEAEPLPLFSARVSPPRRALDVLSTLSSQAQVESSVAGAGEPMEGVLASLNAERVESASTSALNSACMDMPSLSFRSTHFPEEDEFSEDELQADNACFHSAVAETPGISGKKIRSRVSTVNPAQTSMNVGFTPLAAQFSSWLAASPEKPVNNNSPQRGVFSPLAAQHVPGKVQISRQSTPQRRSVRSRASIAAVTSAERGSANDVRKFDESVMADTPERPSYFAEEMAVTDLENEVESLQVTHEDGSTTAESVKNTELPTCIEQQAPSVVPDVISPGSNDQLILEHISDETQLHDKETITTITAQPGWLSVEAEAAEENLPTALPEGDITQAADEKVSEGGEGAELPGSALYDKGHEADHQPASPTDDYATPPHQSTTLPRFVKTVVSKVPLRPEGYISPIKVSKKRSRSLSGGPSAAKKPIFAPSLIPRNHMATSVSPELPIKCPDTPGQLSFVVDDFGDSTLDGIEVDEDDENLPPPTPSAVIRPNSTTPGRSPLKIVQGSVLQGAVVFVDVHTTEGADASGIFVELLTQMGARCVRQWNWNPRASMAAGEVETENVAAGGVAGKVGITHVVYKDGGKRTLEKVRDAGGVVRCVGVGWVLE